MGKRSNLQSREKQPRAPQLKKLKPLNEPQKAVLASTKNMVVCGAAGTGKSLLLVYKALQELEAKKIDRIVIIRSAVPTREVGFLPGSLQDKTKIYELPYEDICTFLYGEPSAYRDLKRFKNIEFISTSYVRGVTLENAFIIVDEFQNMTFHELDSIITRVGNNTKICFCGDIDQSDLQENGLENFMKIIYKMVEFDIVEFGVEHIVRSSLVKTYLTLKHKMKK
jgi:phosphate starvation-inducible protein PhoH